MTEPRHHRVDARSALAFRHLGPRNHNDRKAETARRIDLGAGARAARVARHHPRHGFRMHEFDVALFGEGAARDDSLGIRQRQRPIRLIDEAQKVAVLRLGREAFQMLSADGEEHGRRSVRKGVRRRLQIRHSDPAVAVPLAPRRAHQGDERRFSRSASRNRVPAHHTGKGMGGIDDMRDAFVSNGAGKSVRAAETARANWQRLVDGYSRSAGVGVDRIDARTCQGLGESVRVTRSAQNENARHA